MRNMNWLGLAGMLALSVTVGCAGQRPFFPNGPLASNQPKHKIPPKNQPQTASFPTGQPGSMPTNQMQPNATMPGSGHPLTAPRPPGGQVSPGGAMMMPPQGAVGGIPPDPFGVQQVQFQQTPIATSVPQNPRQSAPHPASMQPFDMPPNTMQPGQPPAELLNGWPQ